MRLLKHVNKTYLGDIDLCENNFKIIRLLLCIMVVHTHCYFLVNGDMIADPLKIIFDVKWGDLGTTIIFFLISGFVITQSLMKNNNILHFLKKRVVKLLPAIFVANVVFILLGFLCVSTSFFDYLFSDDVQYFLYRNTVLIFDIRPRIGFEIFQTNPNPTFVNPQWWTLPWNLKMYALSVLVFLLPKVIRSRPWFNIIYFAVMILCFIPSLKFGWWNYILPSYLTGMFFFINRDSIPVHLSYFFLSLILYFFLYNTSIFQILGFILKGYMLFFLAFIRIKPLNARQNIPELSFGIFLYHMFFQQLLIYYGILNIHLVFILSLLISAVFSYLSYKTIEVPIRRLSEKVALKKSPDIQIIKSE
jgi:peptidoglycan/LPS O-acetylase OafA/YrhL